MTDVETSILRARAENGDANAADQLIESAAEHGDLATLERLELRMIGGCSWFQWPPYSSWRRIQSWNPSSSSRPFGARSRIG